MRVALTNAVLALGDGTNDILRVSVDAAALVVSSAGIAGGFTGAASLTIPSGTRN